MSTFRLIGGPFEIMDHPDFAGVSHAQRVFGDAIEMPDDVARKAISEGAALLPDSQFAKLGFTEEEIRKYPNARYQTDSPPEFRAKLLEARVKLHEFRLGLQEEK